MSRFRFPKASRLYLRKEISELITAGKTIQMAPLKAFYRILPSGQTPLQMAVAVPKRNFKLAVDRNRIKRQIREAYRVSCMETAQYFTGKGATVHILLVYNSRVSPDYVSLKSIIILILQRLQEMHEKNSC